MSQIEEFFKQLAQDAGLQKACQSAVLSADAEAIARLAAERGFTFTAEELKQAWAAQAAELSEEDLAKVAGGATFSLGASAIAGSATGGTIAGCHIDVRTKITGQ